MIDLHCHLDLYSNPHAIVREAQASGIYVLSVTTTPSAWYGTRKLAGSAQRIRTALGLHPQLAHQRFSEVPVLEALLPETKYLGEIGLDGSKEHRATMPIQVKAFERILSAATNAGGRIMSLHSRAAATKVLSSLRKYPDSGPFVLHWFTGSVTELRKAIDMGAWFSVGPAMLASRNGSAIAAMLPRSRVVTETDGPFGCIGNRPLVPSDADMAVQMLAEIWHLPVLEASSLVMANFRALIVNAEGPSSELR